MINGKIKSLNVGFCDKDKLLKSSLPLMFQKLEIVLKLNSPFVLNTFLSGPRRLMFIEKSMLSRLNYHAMFS